MEDASDQIVDQEEEGIQLEHKSVSPSTVKDAAIETSTTHENTALYKTSLRMEDASDQIDTQEEEEIQLKHECISPSIVRDVAIETSTSTTHENTALYKTSLRMEDASDQIDTQEEEEIQLEHESISPSIVKDAAIEKSTTHENTALYKTSLRTEDANDQIDDQEEEGIQLEYESINSITMRDDVTENLKYKDRVCYQVPMALKETDRLVYDEIADIISAYANIDEEDTRVKCCISIDERSCQETSIVVPEKISSENVEDFDTREETVEESFERTDAGLFDSSVQESIFHETFTPSQSIYVNFKEIEKFEQSRPSERLEATTTVESYEHSDEAMHDRQSSLTPTIMKQHASREDFMEFDKVEEACTEGTEFIEEMEDHGSITRTGVNYETSSQVENGETQIDLERIKSFHVSQSPVAVTELGSIDLELLDETLTEQAKHYQILGSKDDRGKILIKRRASQETPIQNTDPEHTNEIKSINESEEAEINTEKHLDVDDAMQMKTSLRAPEQTANVDHMETFSATREKFKLEFLKDIFNVQESMDYKTEVQIDKMALQSEEIHKYEPTKSAEWITETEYYGQSTTTEEETCLDRASLIGIDTRNDITAGRQEHRASEQDLTVAYSSESEIPSTRHFAFEDKDIEEYSLLETSLPRTSQGLADITKCPEQDFQGHTQKEKVEQLAGESVTIASEQSISKDTLQIPEQFENQSESMVVHCELEEGPIRGDVLSYSTESYPLALSHDGKTDLESFISPLDSSLDTQFKAVSRDHLETGASLCYSINDVALTIEEDIKEKTNLLEHQMTDLLKQISQVGLTAQPSLRELDEGNIHSECQHVAEERDSDMDWHDAHSEADGDEFYLATEEAREWEENDVAIEPTIVVLEPLETKTQDSVAISPKKVRKQSEHSKFSGEQCATVEQEICGNIDETVSSGAAVTTEPASEMDEFPASAMEPRNRIDLFTPDESLSTSYENTGDEIKAVLTMEPSSLEDMVDEYLSAGKQSVYVGYESCEEKSETNSYDATVTEIPTSQEFKDYLFYAKEQTLKSHEVCEIGDEYEVEQFSLPYTIPENTERAIESHVECCCTEQLEVQNIEEIGIIHAKEYQSVTIESSAESTTEDTSTSLPEKSSLPFRMPSFQDIAKGFVSLFSTGTQQSTATSEETENIQSEPQGESAGNITRVEDEDEDHGLIPWGEIVTTKPVLLSCQEIVLSDEVTKLHSDMNFASGPVSFEQVVRDFGVSSSRIHKTEPRVVNIDATVQSDTGIFPVPERATQSHKSPRNETARSMAKLSTFDASKSEKAKSKPELPSRKVTTSEKAKSKPDLPAKKAKTKPKPQTDVLKPHQKNARELLFGPELLEHPHFNTNNILSPVVDTGEMETQTSSHSQVGDKTTSAGADVTTIEVQTSRSIIDQWIQDLKNDHAPSNHKETCETCRERTHIQNNSDSRDQRITLESSEMKCLTQDQTTRGIDQMDSTLSTKHREYVSVDGGETKADSQTKHVSVDQKRNRHHEDVTWIIKHEKHLSADDHHMKTETDSQTKHIAVDLENFETLSHNSSTVNDNKSTESYKEEKELSQNKTINSDKGSETDQEKEIIQRSDDSNRSKTTSENRSISLDHETDIGKIKHVSTAGQQSKQMSTLQTRDGRNQLHSSERRIESRIKRFTFDLELQENLSERLKLARANRRKRSETWRVRKIIQNHRKSDWQRITSGHGQVANLTMDQKSVAPRSDFTWMTRNPEIVSSKRGRVTNEWKLHMSQTQDGRPAPFYSEKKLDSKGRRIALDLDLGFARKFSQKSKSYISQYQHNMNEVPKSVNISLRLENELEASEQIQKHLSVSKSSWLLDSTEFKNTLEYKTGQDNKYTSEGILEFQNERQNTQPLSVSHSSWLLNENMESYHQTIEGRKSTSRVQLNESRASALDHEQKCDGKAYTGAAEWRKSHSSGGQETKQSKRYATLHKNISDTICKTNFRTECRRERSLPPLFGGSIPTHVRNSMHILVQGSAEGRTTYSQMDRDALRRLLGSKRSHQGLKRLPPVYGGSIPTHVRNSMHILVQGSAEGCTTYTQMDRDTLRHILQSMHLHQGFKRLPPVYGGSIPTHVRNSMHILVQESAEGGTTYTQMDRDALRRLLRSKRSRHRLRRRSLRGSTRSPVHKTDNENEYKKSHHFQKTFKLNFLKIFSAVFRKKKN